MDESTAVELARRLRSAACLPGPSAAPVSWPSDRELLAWLRGMTYPGLYEFAAEEQLARRWIGGDIFGTRQAPQPPPFLAGVDVRAVSPQLVAPLLRRLSMTRPAPDPGDLTLDALAAQPGRVTTRTRTPETRRWAPDAPLLPETTVVPHVVHGVWLGSPLPKTSSFWHNFAAAADHYAGEADFVLWTDIPREHCEAPDSLAGVGDVLGWAERHGIHLVNIFEVFHANAPMTLHTPFSLELSQGVPQGFAAASDHARVEIVYRFGGIYTDGDLHMAPADSTVTVPDRDGYRLFRGRWDGQADPDGPQRLPELLARVAGSRHGFTLNALNDGIVLNDVIVAPAAHPALALWLEGARYNYLRDQREVFGDAAPGYDPASWTWAATPLRSGRVHRWLLARLGIAAKDLIRPAPAVREHSELSWLPPVTGQPPVPSSGPDPLPALMACVDVLRWQHLSRSGDLSLTSVAPLVRGLSDPDTAWTALLLAFPDLSTDLGPVVSVTDCRRNQDESIDAVRLPPRARALLDLAGSDEVWFMGERTIAGRFVNSIHSHGVQGI